MSVSAWPSYEQDEIDVVTEVLRSGKVNYWTGDVGKQFERRGNAAEIFLGKWSSPWGE